MIVALLAIMLSANDPLQALQKLGRDALTKAGLEKKSDSNGSVYWTGGKGEKTLVLVHGVNDQAGTWAAVAPQLAKSFRLLIPDLAGHGESEPKTGELPLSMIVARVHAIIEKEATGKVVLAGNSMGGWVSMLYTFEHPDRVERLILEDSSGMAWPLPKVPLLPKNREEMRVALRAVNGAEDKTPDDVIDAMLARKEVPMARVREVFESLVDARLASLDIPVTLIWGRNDGLLSLEYAMALSERIKNSKLEVIDGAAHIPHRQQPQKFIACLKATF
jgi:pimeloyl-ACP methyl ester carboxylesterase